MSTIDTKQLEQDIHEYGIVKHNLRQAQFMFYSFEELNLPESNLNAKGYRENHTQRIIELKSKQLELGSAIKLAVEELLA